MQLVILFLASAYLSNAVIYDNDCYLELNIRPVVVNLTLQFARLLTVKELEQSISILVLYELDWIDARLVWNPLEYNEIGGFLTDIKLIWRPEFRPYDSLSILDIMESATQCAYVHRNGSIKFAVANVISFFCPMNLKKFPFDEQVCSLVLQSYGLNHQEIQINGVTSWGLYIPVAGNGEWMVDTLTINSTSGYENHNPKVTFTFYFHRTPTFYVILIIMPSFALTFLCVIGMFWTEFSAEFMEKLGLGFAVILAMCSIFQMMENPLPKTTQLPALDIYDSESIVGDSVNIAQYASLQGVLVVGMSYL